MGVTALPWGKINGKDVYLYEIASEGGLCARVSDFGGVVQSIRLPDGFDAALGYDTLEEYLRSETFFGASVGPIADRLVGGSCVLDGETVRLPRNAGPDTMHSGPNGFHRQLWNAEVLPDGVELRRAFAQSNIGFPGTLDARIRFRVRGNTLRIEYFAQCDRETAVSFTNHTYFRLGGESCRNAILSVNASRYAETTCTENPACTGRALPVDGTPLDLRGGVRIGGALDRADFPEIASAGGIDHYFLADGAGMREHARVVWENRELVCVSDAPGVLIYTANGLDRERGKGGEIYGQNAAICLETERFPNAVNLAERRVDALLQPNGRYESVTEFRFHCGLDPET